MREMVHILAFLFSSLFKYLLVLLRTSSHDLDSTMSTDFHPLIKGLASRDNDVDFETNWTILATAIEEIHTQNASQLSFETLYRNAYRLVLKKQGDELYSRVRDLEERWLHDNVRQHIVQNITPSIMLAATGEADLQAHERKAAGERFLRAIKDTFANHKICMNMITDVLMYMVMLLSSDA